MSAPELPDLPASEELRDPLTRAVAAATVVTTLAAAVVGFLLAGASRGDDLADVTAQRLAAQASGRQLRTQHQAQADHQSFVLAEQQRRRASVAVMEGLFAEGPGQREHELEEARWNEVAARTQELTTIEEDAEDGPERDPTFPSRFFARHTREPVRLGALQDAANQVSSVWEGRVARYTAILTMFAVALYLFGLSFTMQPRVRRLFAAVGAMLLVSGVGLAAAEALAPVPRPPPESAEAFADAQVALRTSATPEDYREAQGLFTRALELHPRFARAYVGRADATFLAGSPQRGGFASLTTPEALRSAIADLRAALDLGADQRSVLASLGFYVLVQGLEDGDTALLEESVRFTEEALGIDRTDPVLHFNLGMAHLAAGRQDEARAAYEAGVRRVIYTDPEEGALRGSPALEEEWVAGALTDLELVLRHRGEAFADVVREMKELVVGSVSAGEPGVGESAVRLTDLSADVYPSEVQWRGVLEGYDPERDVVSAQWYAESGLGWAVFPEVSGPIEPGVDAASGDHFDLRNYLSATLPPRCLEDGAYRVEVYVNGVLTGVAETEAVLGDLASAVDRDVDAGYCRPSTWEPSVHGLPGILTGHVAPDESAGVYVFRLDLPRAFEDLAPEEASELFVGALPDSFAYLFPAPAGFVEAEEAPFFMGFSGPLVHRYAYEGGEILVGSGILEGGSAAITAAVFAPTEEVDAGTPRRVFESLVPLT